MSTAVATGSLLARTVYVVSLDRCGNVRTVAEGGRAVTVVIDGEVREFPYGDVVPLPQLGEHVRIAGVAGHWVVTGEPALPAPGRVEVRLLSDDGEVVVFTAEVRAADASAVVTGAPDLDLASVALALGSLAKGHEEWKRRLSEAACALADQEDVCGRFDAFMEDWGLEPRERNFEVGVQISGEIVLVIEGRTTEDVREIADRDYILRKLGEMRSYELSDLEFDVRYIERS